MRDVYLAAVLVAAAHTAVAQTPAPAAGVPNAVWERTYRSAASEYEVRFAAPAGDALWLVVGVRPKGELGGDQQQQLWRINAGGERTSATILEQATVSKANSETIFETSDVSRVVNGPLVTVDAAVPTSNIGPIARLVPSAGN